MEDLESTLIDIIQEQKGVKTTPQKLKDIERKFSKEELPNKGSIGRELKNAYDRISEERREKLPEDFTGDTGEVIEQAFNEEKLDKLQRDTELLDENPPEIDFDDVRESIEQKNKEEAEEWLKKAVKACREKGESTEDLKKAVNFRRSTEEILDELEGIYKRDKTEYLVLVALPHIVYHPDEETEIGNKTIIPPNSKNYSDYKQYFEDSESRGKFEVEIVFGEEDPVLEIEIEAYGIEQARKWMKEEISQFLDICSYANPNKDLEDLPMPNAQLQHCIFAKNKDKGVASGQERDANMKGEIEWNELKGMQMFDKAARKDTELSNRFERGIHFFRKSNIMDSQLDRTIFLLASLEALIVEDGKADKETIIERVLNITQIGGEREEEIRESLNKLYDARNDALHSGIETENLETDLEQVKFFIGNLIITEMEGRINKDGIETLKEFKSKYGTMKKKRYQNWKKQIQNTEGIDFGTTSIESEMISSNGEKVADVKAELEFIDEGEAIHKILRLIEAENTERPIIQEETYCIETDLSENSRIEISNIQFICNPVIGIDPRRDLPVETSSFNYNLDMG